MDLRQYVDHIHQQLAVAAEAGGEHAGALAERILAPLDSAIRLALQDLLVAAAEEITRELAPGSVELRLRGRNPEFVVTPPPNDGPVDEGAKGEDDVPGNGGPGRAAVAGEEGDETAVARVNLRMPDRLKARVELAAAGEGLSRELLAGPSGRYGPGQERAREAGGTSGPCGRPALHGLAPLQGASRTSPHQNTRDRNEKTSPGRSEGGSHAHIRNSSTYICRP